MLNDTNQWPVTPVNGTLKSSATTSSHDVTEARQESQIWTAYSLSRYLQAGDLKVAVRAGTAVITGIVTEDVNKELAQQIALSADGITSVDNRIEVVPNYIAPRPPGHRSFGDMVEEATINAAVKSKLSWSRHADGLRVEVSSSRGKVRLMGSAISVEAVEAAGRLAASTLGVCSVSNQLVVEADKVTTSKGIGTDITDSWITLKVKSILMYSTHVAGADISVSTRAAVVKLTGKLNTAAEVELAVELAGHVRGVKSVDSDGLGN